MMVMEMACKRSPGAVFDISDFNICNKQKNCSPAEGNTSIIAL